MTVTDEDCVGDTGDPRAWSAAPSGGGASFPEAGSELALGSDAEGLRSSISDRLTYPIWALLATMESVLPTLTE